MRPAPGREELIAAHERVRPHLHRTPVLTSAYFDRRLDAELYFKCENFQKVGAFKARGGVNTVLQLDAAEIERGVATHSSGNHAQAVAFAARLRGARASIVMPENAPRVKVEAVEGYGAEITFCAPTLAAREATIGALIERCGAVLIHPYDDWRIIAGQATAAKELFEEVPRLDVLVVPVGGGGLLAGSVLAARHFSPGTAVIGAEPSGADDAKRSLESGVRQPMTNPRTLADGLRTALGERPFEVIRDGVERILTVGDDAIVATMRQVWERLKIVIEPSAAVPLAALGAGREAIAGRRIGVVFSGGNVDLDTLPFTLNPEPR